MKRIELKEDDVVLCKVTKIEGTTVFLDVEGADKQGSMVLSEVAAGRIRNLRQYVSPNRLVVCKILRIYPDHIELSLRRVTGKEREAALDVHKKEKAFRSVLKFVGENPEEVIEKIREDYTLGDFFVEMEEDSSLLEKYVGKENVARVLEIFSEKEGGEKVVHREFKLTSDADDGLEAIQYILDVDAEVHYLGSGRFSVSIKGKDFKEANSRLQEILSVIDKRAKEKKALVEIKKEK